MPHLYQDLPPELNSGNPNNQNFNATSFQSFPTTSAGVNKIGMILPNPAPDVEPNIEPMEICIKHTGKILGTFIFEKRTMFHAFVFILGSGGSSIHPNSLVNPMLGDLVGSVESGDSIEPKKKKYAKEAWPGRKQLLTSGI